MMNKKVLFFLPLALLAAMLWLTDGLDAFAHQKVRKADTARLLVDISGQATMDDMDWVCVQDTLGHHVQEVIENRKSTRNLQFGVDVANLSDTPEGHLADTGFHLKMDFIQIGIDQNILEIFAELEQRGLQISAFSEENGVLTASLSGSLAHPQHPGERVALSNTQVRVKWTPYGQTWA
ncbi:MAG: hypothetical protein H6581_07480 [Bacteroidia bacterium]|nr:hypothetical protein [Bacteroidia bacterium]